MTTIMNAEQSMALDPEEEAFRALKATICSICQKNNITGKDDVRLRQIVDRYKDRYPSLTPELIDAELLAANMSPIESVYIDDELFSDAASVLTPATALFSTRSISPAPGCEVHDYGEEMQLEDDQTRTLDGGSNGSLARAKEDESECWSAFRKMRRENRGYNPLTYTFLLASFLPLTFLATVVVTYLNYNVAPYRDWALAGGVTSTSAEFRVRGPSSDDGKRREFVVSTSSNLAIEKHQILNAPVSYGDFAPEDHSVRRISLKTLSPSTEYYYGITRPQSIPNSAVVAGTVGTFETPAPEGTRMDFTIALGSCALTGSKSEMFANVLDMDPLLFLHMGDFHYEDLNTLDIDERLEAYDKVMGSPSQRLLYMQTIFSYIWDDHDWLGNNQDSDPKEAAAIAKQAYSLGIPHYELGSPSTDEANAAKYQAFTIGTVRFIITDLRSESVRSSEYYSGKVYSKEQKRWLFNELSRAENYDFVVWVSTRPWTDPEKLGSDSWGGFVNNRNELAAHIASTIGAGPRNLLVLSGDNHMVAFDDGSSTDYSGQDNNPGGFPLLHSGPLTNYGGLSELFIPNTNYFTDGCMSYSNELNHQFSTVEFYFPPADDDWSDQSCIRIKSFSEDSSNIIFEKEMCGDLMKYGTPEQDTCTLEKMSVPTMSLFSAAAGLIVINGLLVLLVLELNGCSEAFSYFGIGALFSLLTIGAAVAGATCFSTWGVNMLSVSALVLAQSVFGSLFVAKAVFVRCYTSDNNNESVSKSGDGKDVVKTLEKDEEMDTNTTDEYGAATHDGTINSCHAHMVIDAKEVAFSNHSIKSEKSKSKMSSVNSATSKSAGSPAKLGSVSPTRKIQMIAEGKTGGEGGESAAGSATVVSGGVSGNRGVESSAGSTAPTRKIRVFETTHSAVTEKAKPAIDFAEEMTGGEGGESAAGSAATEKEKSATVVSGEMPWNGRVESSAGSTAPTRKAQVIETTHSAVTEKAKPAIDFAEEMTGGEEVDSTAGSSATEKEKSATVVSGKMSGSRGVESPAGSTAPTREIQVIGRTHSAVTEKAQLAIDFAEEMTGGEGVESAAGSAATEKEKSATVVSGGMSVNRGVESSDGSVAPETGDEILEDLTVFEDNIANMLPSAKSLTLAAMFRAAKPFSGISRRTGGDCDIPSAMPVPFCTSPHDPEVATASTSRHPFICDIEDDTPNEEGIEVTNPTNRGTKVRAKISPNLIEL